MGGAAAFFAARRAFSAARRHAPKLGYPSRSQSSDCWLWRCSGGRKQAAVWDFKEFSCPRKILPSELRDNREVRKSAALEKGPYWLGDIFPLVRTKLVFVNAVSAPRYAGPAFRQVAGGYKPSHLSSITLCTPQETLPRAIRSTGNGVQVQKNSRFTSR